ncbi:TPA: LPXTG cell wall anchor domain-containing protein [Enterococcus faecalis]|nr:LPXTG cell wall anchor domain-containing protein [Enterococcus faecalis]
MVGTQNGNIIITSNDGTTKTVEAKAVGGEVQKDGTVKVKAKDGKMKVLPQTGEKENLALSIMGSLTALASGFFLVKRNKKEQA